MYTIFSNFYASKRNNPKQTFNPNDLRINVPSVKISTSEHCIKNLTTISYVTLRNVFLIIRIMITYILLLDSFFWGGGNIFFTQFENEYTYSVMVDLFVYKIYVVLTFNMLFYLILFIVCFMYSLFFSDDLKYL